MRKFGHKDPVKTKMKIQNTILAVLLLVGTAVAYSPEDAANAKEAVAEKGSSQLSADPPNVLFLCVDDLKPVLGCYGFDDVHTPNIDRLAERGTVFLKQYCQQALCAPSRMSMFTGLRPDTTGVWDLNTRLLEACPSAITMQQYFKDNGYVTAGGGKVMHGAKMDHPLSWSIPFRLKPRLPYAPGFDVPAHDGCLYQGETVHKAYGELLKTDIKEWKKRVAFLAARNALPATECLDVPDAAYSDGALANYSIGLLEDFAKEGRPFFLTVGFAKPHLPFTAPKKYWDLFDRNMIEVAEYRELPRGAPAVAGQTWGELKSYSDVSKDGTLSDERQRELIHGYYACVAYVDAQIGKILDTLKKTGLDESTVIVLWGDHGWHLGDHGIWCKHSNFEQATHSPLIISAPEFPISSKTESTVESVDIFPTLCELAGLPVPEQLEGTSLVPVLKDPKVKVKDFAISQYPRGNRMGYALRTERYRMVTWSDKEISKTGKFDASKIDAVELYDYQTDPLETVNLALNPECKDEVDDLLEMMSAYFNKMNHDSIQAGGAVPATD